MKNIKLLSDGTEQTIAVNEINLPDVLICGIGERRVFLRENTPTSENGTGAKYKQVSFAIYDGSQTFLRF